MSYNIKIYKSLNRCYGAIECNPDLKLLKYCFHAIYVLVENQALNTVLTLYSLCYTTVGD